MNVVVMSKPRFEKLLGPRLSHEQLAGSAFTYLLPGVFLGSAALLLIASIFLPYWNVSVTTPQHPAGLEMEVYLSRLEGDVAGIESIQRDVGVPAVGTAAELERSLSIAAVVVIALLVVAAVLIHNQFAALLSLPAAVFPAVFVGDLYYWLQQLGPTTDAGPAGAPISPAVPPLVGSIVSGPFVTAASPGLGFVLALVAALFIVAGLWFHRRAYKPLVEALGF